MAYPPYNKHRGTILHHEGFDDFAGGGRLIRDGFVGAHGLIRRIKAEPSWYEFVTFPTMNCHVGMAGVVFAAFRVGYPFLGTNIAPL